jgi:ribonucleoside-diphosphate reductase alpha chain
MAWKKGVKSLYYCRSLSIARADNVSEKAVAPTAFTGVLAPANDGQAELPLVARAMALATGSAGANPTDYEECLACQ